MSYEKLFSPIKIGNVELRNRTVMTAMGVSLANFDGTPSELITDYYVKRAAGGTGLIINEVTRVDDETGVTEVRQLCLTKEENIPAFKAFTDAVHAEGAKIFAQLHHPGRQTYVALNNGGDSVISASAQSCGLCQQPTRAMTTEEVKEMIQKFIKAAKMAKASGYDGVELHAAHGYLLEQFISPYTNHREDEYGGDLDGRLKMIMEIIEGIHKECGEDYPISVRMDADECLGMFGFEVNEITLDEAVPTAKKLEAAGVNVLNVTTGIYETANSIVEPNSFAEGWRSPYVKAIKDAVSIPVMGNAVTRHPAFAEKLLQDGNQDLISMGRTFLADPEWANKAKEGREDEIRKCISCLYCFETVLGALGTGDPVKCAINPCTGHEVQFKDLKKDGNGRTVAVVGAGPAGMEAARVLAMRGFKPVVFEANDYVGGQLNFADKPPCKQRITELIATMKRQLEVLGVEIRLGTKADKAAIEALDPYAVIVATGGVAIMPKSIPGADKEQVYSSEEVLRGDADLAGKAVAVIGGSYNGLELAEFLAEKGCRVSVIEMRPGIGTDIYLQNQLDLMAKMGQYGVNLKASEQLVSIGDGTITIKNVDSGEEETIVADAVAFSVGTRPINELAGELEGRANVICIGDAAGIGRIGDATRSGYEAAFYLE